MIYRSLKKTIPLFALTSALISGYSQAQTIATSPQTATVSMRNTNFLETLTLDKFDSSLGNLTSIDIIFTGTVDGTVSYENLSTSSPDGLISTQLQASMSLKTLNNDSVIDVSPLVQDFASAGIYDGSTDYAGTSGGTYSESVSKTNSQEIFNAGLLNQFSGAAGETIDLRFSAFATSGAFGGGNLQTFVETNAGAEITVVYKYETNVPEPASVALLVFGLGGLVLIRRKRITQSYLK